MKSRIARWTATAFILAATALLCGSPSRALAFDKGFRLELGPDVSFNRATGNYATAWTAAASLGVEGWGAGPLGGMFHFSQGASFSDLTITDQGITPTVTYITQFDVGPTLGLGGKLLHFRVGAGPWFAYSTVSQDSLAQLAQNLSTIPWSKASFMGLATEARLDLNLPIISPFLIVEGHRYGMMMSEETSSGGSVATQGGNVRGTAGVRLNLIPYVKLGLAGTVGFQRNGISPVFSAQDAGTYGLSVWLVVLL